MRKKILFVSSSSELVGVAKHCLNLINDLSNEYEIGLVVREKGWLTEQLELKCPNVEIYCLTCKLSLVSIIFSNLKLLSISRSYEYIHLHGRFSLFISALSLYINKRSSYIYTVHQFFDLADEGHLSVKRKVEFYLIKSVNKIISVSHSLFLETKALFPNNKHYFINNYALPNPYLKEVKTFPSESIKILMIGRLSKEKAFSSVFPIFAELRNMINFSCDIYGEGDDKIRLLKDIDHFNLQDCVALKGVCDDAYSIISSSDVVLIPSYSESFSLVAIEAMLSKVPVIARNVPGLNNVVSHEVTGMLFNNEREIISIISHFINDSNLTKYVVDFAYKNAIKSYTFESVREIYEEVYQ